MWALEVSAPGITARGVSRVSQPEVRGGLADFLEGAAEIDRAWGFCGEHGGEPADSQRRPLGAPAGAYAHGGYQWPSVGQDGRAHQRNPGRIAGRFDRPTEGA